SCSRSWRRPVARRRHPRRRCTEGRTAMTREEFARRRRQLVRLMGRDSIAILPAAPVRHRNNDVEYPYRQDSDFHYLTGFGEPEAVAVLVPGRPRGHAGRAEVRTPEPQASSTRACPCLIK